MLKYLSTILLLLSPLVFAQPCTESFPFNESIKYVQCTFPLGSQYLSTNAASDSYGSLLVPWPLPPKTKLKAHFDGYGAILDSGDVQNSCYGYDYSEFNTIVTRNCPGHFPNLSLYPGEPLDWGGVFNGELAYGQRITALFDYAKMNWDNFIDWKAGITLEGFSYGGSTSILQSMLLPEEWRKQVSIVNATLPPLMFVKNTDPIGNYWLDPRIQLAWGDFDISRADITKVDVSHIYYRIRAASNDNIPVFDLAFFHNCDTRKIACFGQWHDGDHSWGDKKATPEYQVAMEKLYSGPDMSVRLDRLLPIFTNSTANYMVEHERGHYNLGLEWKDAGIVDKLNKIVLPIRYRRYTNMGEGLEDQPENATFDLTIRRPQHFVLNLGQEVHYQIEDISDNVTVEVENEITIPDIILASSTEYKNITLTKVAPGC